MRYSVALVCGPLVLALALLTCQGRARSTYRVTAAQLEQMGAIAGITPCPQGPTLVMAVKRSRDGGGVVHIECPLARRERR